MYCVRASTQCLLVTLSPQDDAIERERAAAAARGRELADRLEQQLAEQRARLLGDQEVRPACAPHCRASARCCLAIR